MTDKCKYFPNALCLTGDTSKCQVEYNNYNKVCPYETARLADRIIPDKLADHLEDYNYRIKEQIKK